MPKLTIYTAIYKNEKNIIPFYEHVKEEIIPYIDDYEILFIDDASPDNSWEILLELQKKDANIKLVRHSRNFGAVAANYTAMRYSSGDCFIPKACDLQEPSKLLLDMYDQWKIGYKVVIAVRNSRRDPFISKFFSNMYYKIVKKAIFPQMPDGGFDTYLIDRTVKDELLNMKEKNSAIPMQLLWMGYKTSQIYYDRQKREIGKSSWSFAKKIKLFIDSVVGFSYSPIRIMTCIGGIYTILAFIFMIHVIISRFNNNIPVLGYTTLLSVMLFSFGLIMVFFGVLGEYIWRTFDAVRKRPISVVEETIGFDKSDINNMQQNGECI